MSESEQDAGAPAPRREPTEELIMPVLSPERLTSLNLSRLHIHSIAGKVSGGSSNIEDVYPLTPLQEGLLFHHLMSGNNDSYVLSTVLQLDSREIVNALIGAVQAVIGRHEVLRAAVLWEDLPRPLHVIHRRAILPVEEFSLERSRDPVSQLRELADPRRQTWDLKKAPLVRLLIAADPSTEKWYALLQLHHIICDHGSLRTVVEEIVHHLNGDLSANPARGSHKDHVEKVLAAAKQQDAEKFFRRKLGDVVEPTFPFGLTSLGAQGSRIKEASRTLSPEFSERVKLEGRKLGVSAARLFHAAWGLVLARTSGRDDVVFGTVILASWQKGSSAARTLGMSINTLPLRLQLRGLSAKELVRRTNQELSELLGYEQIPLVLAQRCSGVSSSTPLFGALLNVRKGKTLSEVGWDGVSGVRVLTAPEAQTNYPFTLTVDEFSDRFELIAQTDERVNPARVLGYVFSALQSLVNALESTPDVAALTLRILPESERLEVLRTFNETESLFPRDSLVHELFEEQVIRMPDAVAAEHAGNHLTYAELNCRANQLARHLRNRGVGPDQPVGICVERSLEMVVGLLGILKAGGAYVPLDPNYPTERLQHMLADSAPRVVLTQSDLLNILPSTTAEVIALNEELKGISGNVQENLSAAELSLSPLHLVYVIYTSGSTGRPKGTAMAHRSMVNLVEWHRKTGLAGTGKRVLQFAALSFDVAFQETFSTLCTGGTLVLLDEWVRRDAQALAAFLRDHSIQTLFIPPLMLQAVSESASATGVVPEALRDVITAGEQLRISPEIASLFRRLEKCRLHNHYGPTETHVVTALTLTESPDQWPPLPTIGRPISNVHLYVLDGDRRLLPIGVAGEIYIGGVSVARGYLGNSELGGERFVEDPFSGEPGARMYRTGDVGRWREDGTLEYLGRNDFQVKISGYRVELGEIEVQLALHRQVKEAAVVARNEESGQKRLVAYVTPRDGGGPNVEELRAHLKGVLPEYMLPSAIVLLENLPLTPNGKLDRRALPAPKMSAHISRRFEPPQGELEEILAALWCNLLHLDRVGRMDNFFELGGHSLLIVQLMERLRRKGLSVNVRTVYDNPVLVDLANELVPDRSHTFEVPNDRIPFGCHAITPEMLPLVKLTPEQIETIVRTVPGGAENIQDIYPLAPLQEGLLFHHLMNRNAKDAYLLGIVVALPSPAQLSLFAKALQKVADRHDILRSAVLWEKLPRPVQVVYRNAALSVREFSLDPGQDPVEQIKSRILEESHSLDLKRAPLMRLEIASDSRGTRSYGVIRMHHLVCDHESLETVLEEVMTILAGQPGVLRDPLPYRNHIAQALALAETSDTEAFFAEKLRGIDEPTAPFGLLNVHENGSDVNEAYQECGPELAAQIRAQARRLGVSAATLFHAAWSMVVSRTSGRSDVVFGSLFLGRLHGNAGTQQILGMFINTLPVCLRLRGLSSADLVLHVQRELVDLLTQEQASLSVAQRCSGIIGHAPLFSSLLNYRHTARDALLNYRQDNEFESEVARAARVQVLAIVDRTNYPITLSIDDFGEGFGMTAMTDRRIDPRRILGYTRTALSSLIGALQADDPTPAITLKILPDDELRQLIGPFDASIGSEPDTATLHELFEKQVARAPLAAAVTCDGRSLTYRELNERANQLARYLRARDVGTDQLVAICVDRSLEMIVAILGVLKAGGGYVPLDPANPRERLDYMLHDAAPRVLLTQEALKARFASATAEVIALDEEWSLIAMQPADNLERGGEEPRPGSLAYVIYTSGSTGTPKGVMVEHRNVTRLFTATAAWFHCNADDVWTMFHSFGFDFSVWELWGALMYGGRLVLVPHEMARSPSDFYSLICDEQVTVLNQTPSAFLQLIDAQARSSRSHFLRLVIFGGEALEFRTLRPWVSRNGASMPQLVNMYGITETTVHVTYRLLSKEEIETEPGSLIGQPIPDLRVYLLDEHKQPVPIGVPGEIYVSGAGVARGYLNQSQLTAERFLRDPFCSDGNVRMYRSGDLGRWRSDGVIEYLGRNDQQVKIRGFRIELGEIEAQLARHPGVKDAVVLAREDCPGEFRLVAYLVPRYLAADLNVDALRSYAKDRLPEHMVPGAFVLLPNLPLTPNGKLDRRALPPPEQRAYAQREYQEPHGAVEKRLARVWQELTHVKRVGRRDDFFELGGHSLLALKLLFLVDQEFGFPLNVTDVYKNPTLHELASHISGTSSPEAFVNLAQEAALGDEIVHDVKVIGGFRRNSQGDILLTGCTGFVGRFLLTELLEQTDATVYCLVRASSQEEGGSRIKSTLVRWDLWRDAYADRVIAVPGDLRLPGLGLAPRVCDDLSGRIGSIYHCATSMNHLETYAMAHAANVEAVRQLVTFATKNRLKLINYVSTLGVFGVSERARVIGETTPIDFERHPAAHGYAASKWVGDKILLNASQCGVPCNIFRLGLVWADAEAGRYDELQREYRLLKSCLLSGYGIERYRYGMAPTPVDRVARGVVFLANEHPGGDGVFHISASSQDVGDIFERCNRVMDVALDLVPFDVWIAEVKRLHDAGLSLPIVPLVQFAFYTKPASFDGYWTEYQSDHTQFDCSATERELERGGVILDGFGDDQLKLCLEWMVNRDSDLVQRRRGSSFEQAPSLHGPEFLSV